LRETGITKIVSVFDTLDEAASALERDPAQPAAVSTPTWHGRPGRQSSHQVERGSHST
jgi:hypothetical protein